MKASLAEDVLQPLKELVAGRLDPLPVDRGVLVSGDRPVGLEAAKVVEADHVIEHRERRMRAAHQSKPRSRSSPQR